MAGALIEMGVAPGDRIAVQIDKSLEALQLYVGAVMAGGVFLVEVSKRLHPPRGAGIKDKVPSRIRILEGLSNPLPKPA